MNEDNKRIIKFRVWYDKTKKMYYPTFFYAFENENMHWDWKDGDFTKASDKVMQFIGLKDRNNQEIYEGDIINFETYGIPHGPERDFIKNVEVYYDEKIASFCFGRFNSEDYEYTYQMTDRIDEKTIEVVGNIFEKKI